MFSAAEWSRLVETGMTRTSAYQTWQSGETGKPTNMIKYTILINEHANHNIAISALAEENKPTDREKMALMMIFSAIKAVALHIGDTRDISMMEGGDAVAKLIKEELKKSNVSLGE